jgi:uncharacterized protein YhfF
MKLEFSRHILKNTQISNLVKFRAVGDELSHADGQTDRQIDRYDEVHSRFFAILKTRIKMA